MAGEVRIGVSACLIGRKVRFDGQHKKDDFVTGTLAGLVKLVPLCPEVEVGLGVPRETIRLVKEAGLVQLRGTRTGTDHTAKMRSWSRERADSLADADLSGFILKKDSPTCGAWRVKLYGPEGGAPTRTGRGLFAEALMARLPLLPVEEEGRLHDVDLRENFFERVFAYRRLVTLLAPRWQVGQLVKFHSAEKFLLLAHDEPAYRALGRLVAKAKEMPRRELGQKYSELFMGALGKPATRGRQANVLQHMAGFFKAKLEPDDRAELTAAIHDYRKGLVPLLVPLTLVKHHARRLNVEYLAGQTYLDPHPRELLLRNHA